MPMIDMPIEKLEAYTGSSPCPADIDEYWDSALNEAMNIDCNVEFVKSNFTAKDMECFDMYFSGTKGARIHTKFVKPANADKAPALLWFHGLSGKAPAWPELIAYAHQGMCVAAMDCRGQGGTSTDPGGTIGTTGTTFFVRGLDGDKHDLYLRDLFLDTAILAKIVMGLDYVDETRVGAQGGSQGGGLSLACASLVPGLKKCAPHVPYMLDYKRVWDMDLAKDAYDGLKYYFRNFDPAHEHEDEIFEKLGYVDVQNMVKRIKAEVLMTTGLMDTICPPSTQYAAYNKITSKKKHIIYPDYAHETPSQYSELLFGYMSEL